ncbi:hypothetical protein F4859DRAFT_476376 [Xylaria cf. heliscus]|nr:hypothetical protein F4859DRAFT_476376 [Xylaria cf. heliscus]
MVTCHGFRAQSTLVRLVYALTFACRAQRTSNQRVVSLTGSGALSIRCRHTIHNQRARTSSIATDGSRMAPREIGMFGTIDHRRIC